MYPSSETMRAFARIFTKPDRHPYVVYEADDPRIITEESFLTKLLKKLMGTT